MEAEKKNYYDVLDIPHNASPQAIETAYIRGKNAYSGDSAALYSLMTNDECRAILEQIEEAYSVLGFPEKRREYDRIRGFNQVQQQTPYAQKSDSLHQRMTFENRPQNQVQYEDYSSNLIESKVSKVMAQKKFGLEFAENPEMDKKIAEMTTFTGPSLKEIREYKNVTIERMAEMTKVSKSHIIGIENDDTSKLPADVYVRGYVFQYAKVLKLNPDLVAQSYMLHFKKLRATK